MRYMIFDIESVPNPEAGWEPPKDKPDAFPPIPAHQIVSIGVLVLEIAARNAYDRVETKVLYFGNTGTPDDEPGMVHEFLELFDKYNPDLVSYNGRGFDLPVIEHRCMRFGIQCPQLFDWDLRNRFKKEGHLDLQDQLTNYGASMRSQLNIICKAIGMAGKMEVDGSKVDEMIAAGKQADVDAYCLCDVAETAWLLVRWLHVKEAINRRANHEAVHAIKDACLNAGPLMLKSLVDKTNIERLSLEEQLGEMPVEEPQEDDDPELPF